MRSSASRRRRARPRAWRRNVPPPLAGSANAFSVSCGAPAAHRRGMPARDRSGAERFEKGQSAGFRTDVAARRTGQGAICGRSGLSREEACLHPRPLCNSPGPNRRAAASAMAYASSPSRTEPSPPVATVPRHGAQEKIRTDLGGLRPIAGATAWRLRHLQDGSGRDAVRRSLPCDRQGARTPLSQMQRRARMLRRRSRPAARGGGLYREVARRRAAGRI